MDILSVIQSFIPNSTLANRVLRFETAKWSISLYYGTRRNDITVVYYDKLSQKLIDKFLATDMSRHISATNHIRNRTSFNLDSQLDELEELLRTLGTTVNFG